MKTSSLLFFLAFSLLQPALPVRAGDLFNPSPADIQSPKDNPDAVVKRLTSNSDGKTPVIKNLDPAWIATLADRGEPTLYTKSNSHDFDFIGMPIGGIGAGEVYLSGDGQLWDWDIFGTLCPGGFALEQGLAYKTPHKVGDPHDPAQLVFDQGFVIRTRQGDKKDTRTLDKNGFSDITFSGQYPVGSVDYSDPASPVRVHLEAFSPYIPSDLEDSSYPATILNYTVENTSSEQVECTVGGWMENAAGIATRNQGSILLENTAAKNPAYTALDLGMKEGPGVGNPPTIFDDFESGKYDHWKAEGEAFGDHPAKRGEILHNFTVVGEQGQHMVDSYFQNSDKATGTLTSDPFVIKRPCIQFLIGGGNDPQRECVNLLVDGKTVQTATGQGDEVLRLTRWDVKDLIGKTAQLQIVDQSSDGWGHILVDQIAFADAPSGPTIFDDFETGKYDHWKAEGEAFGDRPVKIGTIRHNFAVVGAQGQYMVDSYFKNSDKATGTLTSDPFTIKNPYLQFMIGGGNDPQQECVNLLVDGKTVRTATGRGDEVLRLTIWDVKDLTGKTAQLQIVDQGSGGWGHILVDQIAFADSLDGPVSIQDQTDVGNMALAMMGNASEVAAQVTGDKSSDACLDAPASDSAEQKVFQDKSKLVGALRRTQTLKPGEKMTVSFIVAWYFPNPLNLGLSTPTNRQYGVRFKSAQDVVDHIGANFDRLAAATRAWHDAWYDSTLPYYFLDRTFLNTSTLATSTAYLLSDGRFYGYEGRYSCPGTCTHVWGYQQAMGYLFPDLEKAIMEKVEFVPNLGMNGEGGVAMRGEFDRKPPVDGQAAIILRTYLAHRMSADNSFLQRNYGSVKKATDFLINKFDPTREGILAGPQANTMDAAWFGKITWLSLYYQAALRATAEMADASNDADYAKGLRAIADKGRNCIETQLFNGEYFIQQPDPAHPESPGTFNGCPIEQLMGQNWAYEVGLGDIVDRNKSLTALNSIWKYDYTTDAGLYRDAFKTGRWYAMKDEGGLIMCTFPKGGVDALTKGSPGFAAYDNECWTGSEYEETALMMWDGLVDKALAEIKTVQARYDGAKRNPWDECECGSHYSRAMSSYGVFTAACGFEYDGPKGVMAFAPRVAPENFKAAFTSAEGWGSFSQKYAGKGMNASLTLRYGKLRLKTLSLILPAGSHAQKVKAQVDGKDHPVSLTRQGDRVSFDFPSDLLMTTGQSLSITINP